MRRSHQPPARAIGTNTSAASLSACSLVFQHSFAARAGMTRSRTVFPGSLVDGLLSDLAAEQRAAPELAGQLELDDLRWNLDRLASDNSADANVAAAVSAAVDRAVALQALHGCSDDTLETMLECSAEWHCLTACGPPQRQNQAPQVRAARQLSSSGTRSRSGLSSPSGRSPTWSNC